MVGDLGAIGVKACEVEGSVAGMQMLPGLARLKTRRTLVPVRVVVVALTSRKSSVE